MIGRLSLCLSALLAELRRSDEIADDLEAFHAPSECYADAYADQDRRLVAIVRRHGFGCDELMELAEERTTPRTVGVGVLAPILGALGSAMGRARDDGRSRRARRHWRVA